jgi:hypothetical protein
MVLAVGHCDSAPYPVAGGCEIYADYMDVTFLDFPIELVAVTEMSSIH